MGKDKDDAQEALDVVEDINTQQVEAGRDTIITSVGD